MEKNEIKKEIQEILDNYIASNLPINKDRIYDDLIVLIQDIIDDENEK
jgi:hypothetical protein